MSGENVVLEFYKRLALFLGERPSVAKPEHIMEAYEKAEDQLSMSVSLAELESWERLLKFGVKPDFFCDNLEEIAKSAFQDLAPQMRNEPVRDLHLKFKEMAGIPTDLFIHARQLRDLGDSVVAVTLVADDVKLFREFMNDPDDFDRKRGKVHFSESEDTKDPE